MTCGFRRAALLITMVTCAALTGCKGEDAPAPTGPTCASQLCTPGEKRCFGSVSATCNADAMSFTKNPCGALQVCGKAGSCEDRECTYPGLGTCSSDLKTATQCTSSGTLTTVTCPPGSGKTCAAGDCRNIECTAGERICGYGEFWTCGAAGKQWKSTKCQDTEACVKGACVPKTCSPGTTSCKSATEVATCAGDGTSTTTTTCKTDELCLSEVGGCVPKTCTPITATDVVGGDGVALEDGAVASDAQLEQDKGPLPELEPLDTARATINGVKVKFSNNLSANYVTTKKDLRITMDKTPHKIELSIANLEEFDFSHWKSGEASDVNVTIFYSDGTQRTQGGFPYQSTKYDVDLQKFQGKGGRVIGIFSGTLSDGTNTLEITDGYFDVKRHL